MHLLRRAMAQLTYRSLCPPHDLADRGLLGTPGAHYAHDALQLWEITARYVEGIVQLFYHGDDVVKEDPELQAWCREITEVGLCQAQDRGKTPPQRQELLGPSAQSPFPALPVRGQDGNASPRSRLQAHLLRLRTSRESPPRRPWPSTFHPDRLTCHSTGPNRARTSASEGSARAGDLLARLSSPA